MERFPPLRDRTAPPRANRRILTNASRRWAAFGVLALLLGSAIGYSVAGSVTILHANETAEGAYASESTVNGWTWLGVSYWVTPTPAPTQLSHTVGTPTVLGGAAASYLINSGTAGHVALSWNFTEETLLPISTEFEFTFKVGTSDLGGTSMVKAYIETQLVHLTALKFDLFLDLGTASSTALPIDTLQVTVQHCSGIGTCP